MSDRIFIDTNVLVYAYTTGSMEKYETAKKFLQTSNNDYVISTQVLNEFYVTLVKYKIEHDKIAAAISEIATLCEVQPIKLATVYTALAIKKRYSLSYWDSLILSSSLENLCGSLYSEDMSDGQIIHGEDLKNLNIAGNVLIQNPFA